MQRDALSDSSGITVVIVNWNAGDWLERCVAAVYAQTVQPLEVIVIDNASSDGSALNIISHFPSVRVVAAGKNLGFAAANNLAIRMASRESSWIALLNPDAFPEPTWLEALLDAGKCNPQYVFFGSRLMDANVLSTQDGTGDVYHVSGLVWRKGHGRAIVSSALEPREIFSPCAAAAMYRKDAILEAGGFDEDFFCYVEDVDLGFRLRLLGQRCWYVPNAVVYHVGSASTGKRSDFSVYHGHRNLIWTFIKNMPGVLFWALLPIHVLLNIVTVAYFSTHGQAKVIWRAKWDAIKDIPRMWNKRRKIQAHRRASVMDVWRVLDKRLTLPRHNKRASQLLKEIK